LTPLAMLQQADIAMPEGDWSICNAVYVDDVATAAVKDLLSWTHYLSRHAAMGTLGHIVTLPSARFEQLRAEANESRSPPRTLVQLLRDQPEIRSALLSIRLAWGAFSFLQRRDLRTSIRRKLTEQSAQGIAAIAFHQRPGLPLRLPPQNFLNLSTQSHRYSSGKAERKLAYVPRYSVDTALSRLRAWAEWNHLVREAFSVCKHPAGNRSFYAKVNPRVAQVHFLVKL
jgi:hypothetical protein